MALNPRPSPDGHLLAFAAFDRGLTQVAVMKPETGNWSMLTHSRERGVVANITWSPDGASIYYDRYSDVPQGIYRVPVLGGEEKLILESASTPEALPDGSLLLLRLNARRQIQLFRFWLETGRLQDLPIMSSNFFNAVARASADGKHVIAYGAVTGHETEGQRLLSLDLVTGSSKPLSKEPRTNDFSLVSWAVTHDGTSFLTTERAGALTRVVSIPTNGGSAGQTLFTVANKVWYLEAAPDGSVYASLVDQPAEIVRRSPDGEQTQIVARFPAVTSSNIIVLPDGRSVVTLPASGGDRLMVVEQGKDPVSLMTTAEETSAPMTLVGLHQIAFVIGPAPHQTIALADTTTGRIAGRISPGKGEINSLASSLDGQTLFFVAGRTIWSVPAVGGEAQMIRAGDSVVMDPDGRSLVASLEESSKLRLFRLFLDGRTEREIITDGSVPLMNWPLTPGGLSADGRLLVSLTDSWFNHEDIGFGVWSVGEPGVLANNLADCNGQRAAFASC